jgi:hypothetical protein
MHPNSQWLIEWADRMNAKYGPPKTGIEWCRKLAYFVSEEGNDHPSDMAIDIAKAWELRGKRD